MFPHQNPLCSLLITRATSCSICNFLQPIVTSSLLGPNKSVSNLFSNTPSLRSSVRARDQVSHPYKRQAKCNFCLFYYLGLTANRKIKFSLFLIPTHTQLWLVSINIKHWNYNCNTSDTYCHYHSIMSKDMFRVFTEIMRLTDSGQQIFKFNIPLWCTGSAFDTTAWPHLLDFSFVFYRVLTPTCWFTDRWRDKLPLSK